MKFLILGDSHGAIPNDKISKLCFDAILSVGDFTDISNAYRDLQIKHKGEIEKLIKKGSKWNEVVQNLAGKNNLSKNQDPKNSLKQIMKKITQIGRPVYIVPGNTDQLRNLKCFEDKYENIHVLLGEHLQVGHGISLLGIGDYLNPDLMVNVEQFENNLLKNAKALKKSKNKLIALSHYPPFGILDTLPSGRHIGSKFFSQILNSFPFDLWICGHVHEAMGISLYRNTLLLNAGRAADQIFLADVNDNSLSISIC